jgi:hypothetical protein
MIPHAIRVRSRQESLQQGKARDRFEEAQALWKDDNRFELPGELESESRNLVIGRIEERFGRRSSLTAMAA